MKIIIFQRKCLGQIKNKKEVPRYILPVLIDGSPWSNKTVLKGQNVVRSYCKQITIFFYKSGPLSQKMIINKTERKGSNNTKHMSKKATVTISPTLYGA